MNATDPHTTDQHSSDTESPIVLNSDAHLEILNALQGLRYIQQTFIEEENAPDPHLQQAYWAMGSILSHLDHVVPIG